MAAAVPSPATPFFAIGAALVGFIGLSSDSFKEDTTAKSLEKWSSEITECFRQVNGRFDELNQKINYEIANLHGKIENESQLLINEMEKVHQETKEMYNNLMETINTMGQEIKEEILQTRDLLMVRLQDLANNIKNEGEKTRTLIESNPITIEYDKYRRQISKIHTAVELYTETLLTNSSGLNLKKLKGSCGIDEASISSVPADALDWYYSTIVFEQKKTKNLLHILVKEFEHDTVSLLKVTAVLKMEIMNAFHYSTICDGFADKFRARFFFFSQSTCKSGLYIQLNIVNEKKC